MAVLLLHRNGANWHILEFLGEVPSDWVDHSRVLTPDEVDELAAQGRNPPWQPDEEPLA